VALPVPPLLLITDRKQAGRPLDEIADAAFAAGCRWLSVREKDLTPEDRAALFARLLASGKRAGARVTLHGGPEEATQLGADGVHLAAGGDARAARARLGPSALIGVSCHAVIEIVRAAQTGADYVTLGPLFASPSKPGYGLALGLVPLAEAARTIPIAILALGGVEATNLRDCREAGAAGAAVMGAIMRAPEPGAAMRALIAAWHIAAAHK
jgi:thiamine-phosphate pyrophosphorylase